MTSVDGDCVTFFRPKQHQEAAPFFQHIADSLVDLGPVYMEVEYPR